MSLYTGLSTDSKNNRVALHPVFSTYIFSFLFSSAKLSAGPWDKYKLRKAFWATQGCTAFLARSPTFRKKTFISVLQNPTWRSAWLSTNQTHWNKTVVFTRRRRTHTKSFLNIVPHRKNLTNEIKTFSYCRWRWEQMESKWRLVS